MDDTDEKLLAALKQNARLGISELAAQLRLSRTTVRSRLARLEQAGEIVGFTIVTRADVQQDPVRGLMMIGIEGRGAERIIRQLSSIPEVRAVHSTNGRWDVIAEIGSQTLADFDAVLFRIRRLEGVMQSETNLLLSTRKSVSGTPAPLP